MKVDRHETKEVNLSTHTKNLKCRQEAPFVHPCSQRYLWFFVNLIYSIGPPLWSRQQHACLSRSMPRFDPWQGQVSQVRFFPHLQTNIRKLQAHKVPKYHLAIIIILSYSPCSNEWVCECCVYHLSCLCCLGDGPGIELIPHPGRPPCPCVVKKVCM